MKKTENQEKKLISEMIEHMEISQAGKDFTRKVMERVNLEPLPSRITAQPLVSKTAWIITGILFCTLLVLILTGWSPTPAAPAGNGSSIAFDIPDLNSYTGELMEWINRSMGTLTWYTIGLASLFILTLLNRFLKNPGFTRRFFLWLGS